MSGQMGVGARALALGLPLSAALLCAAALFIIPAANTVTSDRVVRLTMLLLGAGLAAVWLLPRAPAWMLRALRILPSLPHWGLVLGGLILHVIVGVVTDPEPASNARVYLELARRLAAGEEYVARGHYAFYPPGLPLFLAPFVYVMGVGLGAVVAANAVLFVSGAVAIRYLAATLFSPPVATVSLLLYVLWPARLLSSGLASKENLTFTLVLAGLSLFIAALNRARHPKYALAAAGGAAFGLCALAQPGLMLFLLGLPVLLLYWVRRFDVRRLLLATLAVAAGYFAVAGPWQIRNCVVFEGRFCGISTNGGSVAYRANNPLATGAWIAEGEVRLAHLPELEQNRRGFQLAREWILAHPDHFAVLALQKFKMLMTSDDHGAYWAIRRGVGGAGETDAGPVSESRQLAYSAARFASLLFWVVMLGLCLRAAVRLLRQPAAERERCLVLLYPILYCMAVFAVFESGDRQHMLAVGTMLILASWALLGHRAEPQR